MATQVYGKPLPTAMKSAGVAEHLMQCRVELVKREGELIVKTLEASMIHEKPKGAFEKWMEIVGSELTKTRAEIARIDALFEIAEQKTTNTQSNESFWDMTVTCKPFDFLIKDGDKFEVTHNDGATIGCINQNGRLKVWRF